MRMKINSSPKLQMRTSIKLTAVVIIGILIFMILHNRRQQKQRQLTELKELLAGNLNKPEAEQGPQYSLATDPDCKACALRSKHKIHLVTNFFPISLVKGHLKILKKNAVAWGDVLKLDRAGQKELFQQRDRELLDVLQMNLNNPVVLAVHIIYQHEQVVQHISNQKLLRTHKLVFHRISNNPTYEDAVIYIGRFLKNQLVVLANQDVYLGQGWNYLDHEKINEKNIMYALTRHGKKERYCKMRDDCARSAVYAGSHDAFAFILKKIPRRKHLAELRHKHDDFGIENIMIYIFRNELGYEVINPCFVLYIYHVHCGQVHSRKRTRVNRFNNTAMAYFSDHLYL